MPVLQYGVTRAEFVSPLSVSLVFGGETIYGIVSMLSSSGTPSRTTIATQVMGN
jgi:hypothetical protein